jgi:O-antigen/teichoic acid export membrane protein
MFKKIASTFVTKVMAGIINLLIAILISNWLGAEGKGIQGLYFTTIGLAITFISILGLMPITFLFPRKPSLNYYLIVYIWSFTSPILLYFVLKSFNILEDYILFITLTSFISSLVSNNLSIFIIKEKVVYYNLAIFSQPLSLIIFILSFYLFRDSFTIEYYIYSLLFSYIVFFIFSLKGLFLILKENISVNTRTIAGDFISMIRYGGLYQLSAIIQLLCFRGTYYILNHYSTIGDLGVYSNAISISESIWIISKSLSIVFYSRMINAKKEYHKQLFNLFTFASFWLQVSVLIILIILPGSFYTMIFGDEFVELKKILILLLPSALLFGQSLIIELYFAATGKHHINLITNTLGLVIIIGLSVTLVPNFSTIGAAVATSVGYLSAIMVYNYYLRKHLNASLFSHLIHIDLFTLLISKLRITVNKRRKV